MNRLIDACVDRWRTVLLTLAFIFIVGLATYQSIPKESSPDVKIPFIYTSLTLDGIAPEDAERLLIRPVEKKMQSIESVKEMTAMAQEGFASVSLEFQAGFDSDKALDDVRNQVDEAKPDLPTETDEPIVTELNFSKFPIFTLSLTGDADERTLVRVARDLRDKIEGINSVLEAKMLGDREEVLEILIDPLILESYQLSPSEVFERVRNNNILVPAGEMDTGKGSFAIKLPGLIETAIDLRNIPLKVDQGVVTTLSDVATIRRGFKDVTSYARVNGKPAIGLQVSKRTGANIIETVDAVKKLVEVERAFWPAGVKVVYSNDESQKTKDQLTDLQSNVILAVLLVLIVLLVVMGFRSALLVSFAIPGAFLFGILCIGIFGFTLNVVVLFALILSIGMLVDSAIVVVEYADRLMMDGATAKQAYSTAAKRMAWPIIASTATTLVVFMPLLFWPGIVGQFMKYMPITLIVTLTGSLLMALVFMPTLGTKLGGRKRVDAQEAEAIVAAETGEYDKLSSFTRGYVDILQALLKRPITVMFGLTAVVVSIFIMFGMFGAGVEFFPKIEPVNARIDIRAQGNFSVNEKNALVAQVEERIKDMDEIRVRFVNAGKISMRNDTPEDIIGQINMEFVDWKKRRKADVILADIKARTKDIPGIIVESAKQEEGPPVGKAVQLQFSSRFPELIQPALEDVLRGMKEVGGFINISDERPVPSIEWEITVNRELAGQYDIDVNMIGQVVKMTSNGIIVNTYRPDDADDEIDIITRFPEEFRNISQLDRLRVYTPKGLVPIANFVEREPKQRINTVKRTDSKRSMYIRADLEPGLNVDAKVQELKAWMEQNVELDPRLTILFKGEDEEQKEAGAFLAGAFMIALFSMALILVTQFNSMYHMIVTMSAVVFSTGGVFLGLLVTGTSFGVVMCGVGVISLAGIVVNNNIIFIDTFKVLREQGVDMIDALCRTGAQRLRPILLTAGTTVLGLLPMVYEMNVNFATRELTFGAPSSQWWVQLSTAIAGGLAFATILTLFFTPCLLIMEERVPSWFRRGVRKPSKASYAN
ncbi:MAG: efflux RND transporter permease subunit [Rickettsiales bacterium]|nr:efflux RND transporter permease subunit [Rickettsiales bacterium]